MTAGTADIPVAEEAAVTADILGDDVDRVLWMLGVAGIHRLFAKLDRIRAADVVIVVAGMEGALASVVGGLVDTPVIAVPTSIGYGSNLGGLSALLSMLNELRQRCGDSQYRQWIRSGVSGISHKQETVKDQGSGKDGAFLVFCAYRAGQR